MTVFLAAGLAAIYLAAVSYASRSCGAVSKAAAVRYATFMFLTGLLSLMLWMNLYTASW
jgi:hypothetical protein